jgi:hypothetical protein
MLPNTRLKSIMSFFSRALVRYPTLYPHNPKNVIEVHIPRKVKAGRTREQALDELEAESQQRQQ